MSSPTSYSKFKVDQTNEAKTDQQQSYRRDTLDLESRQQDSISPPPDPFHIMHPKALGNLGSALKHYEHSHNNQHLDPRNWRSHNQPSSTVNPQSQPPGSLTINIPAEGGLASQLPKYEGDRERSSTFGSEFDLGWALGKDGRAMSLSGLLTPVEGDGMSEATGTTFVSGSTLSSVNSSHVVTVTGAGTGSEVVSSTGLPPLKGNETSSTAPVSVPLPCLPESCSSSTISNATIRRGEYYASKNRGKTPANADAPRMEESHNHGLSFCLKNLSPSDSNSALLIGELGYDQPLIKVSNSNANINYQARTKAENTSKHDNPLRFMDNMIVHTPPTQLGTSYENSHFGKRMRAGSISGRLRSASDLEDSGLIDKEQKSILKDLIIAGDNSVQCAIDQYEAGDSTALEHMIKSGALLTRSADIDLLGDLDLDLDFLNVHEDDDMVFGVGSIDDIGGNEHAAENNRQLAAKEQNVETASIYMKSEDPGVRPPAINAMSLPCADDGIGDLEFNGDFSSPCGDPQYESLHSKNSRCSASQKTDDSDEELQVPRMRTNSLAFPGLLSDCPNLDGNAQISFGQWMDKNILPPGQPCDDGASLKGHSAPNVVDTNGSLCILNPSQGSDGKNSSLTDEDVKFQCDMLMQKNHQQQNGVSSPTSMSGKSLKIKKGKEKRDNTSKEKRPKKEKKEKKIPTKKKIPKGLYPLLSTPTMESNSFDCKNPMIGRDHPDDEERKEIPSGLGKPRSMSDPNLSVHLDENGLLHVNGPAGWVGAYSPNSRQIRINRFLEKRNHRVWVKKVKYDVRKNFADSRLRVKGRFVKKEDEMLMRELMSLT